MSSVKALVLAAGVGLRLRPLTDSTPKCLVQVAGRPLLDYWLANLIQCGVREVLINTHSHREQMRSYLADVNRRNGLRLWETYEPSLLGSAGAFSANPCFADGAECVIVIYADNFSLVRLDHMLAFHHSHNDPVTMLLFQPDDPRACGIVRLGDHGRIVDFVEKPPQSTGTLASAGVYIIDASAYRQIADMRASDLGLDVFPHLIGRMRGWLSNSYHKDIGTPESYSQVQKDAPALLQERGYFSDGTRPCVFFDRDGTLLEFVHYLIDPRRVRLVPDGAAAIRRLREIGFACVVVTNQSVVGSGILSEQRLEEIHDEMYRQLTNAGVMLDALYYCPLASLTTESRESAPMDHEERKPGPGLLKRAARNIGLRLEASWMVGDTISDVLAGSNANCRGAILLLSGKQQTGAQTIASSSVPKAHTLMEAVDVILESGPIT